MADENRDIAMKLLESRNGVQDSIAWFQEVRAENAATLNKFRAEITNELNEFMQMCSRSAPELAEMLGKVVVKFGHKGTNGYGYVRPFYRLAGHGIMGQVNSFGLTYHFDSKTIITINDESQDEALMGKLDTTIVGVRNKSYLVEFPSMDVAVFPRQAKYSLALIISFFYNRGPGKDPKWKLKNAIASAKKLIEETDYLAEDGYKRSVTECLFCLAYANQEKEGD